MADEILEETQTEGATETTPETTPSEGITEGTQTEGTTGNGYLTKPYLVRNLQTFWGKIKQYIANQKFVNESYVDGALLNTASKEALTSLANTVNGKAEQSEFKALEQLVESKADKSALDDKVNKDGNKVLSTHDFETKYKNQLDSLKLATKTEDGLMSAEDKTKLEGIATGATAVTVDSDWINDSENPVQSKLIRLELAKKVDVEKLEDPSDLKDNGLITISTDDNGHLILDFNQEFKHFKIHSFYKNSYECIEKFVIKQGESVKFSNLLSDESPMKLKINNPDGKEGENWILQTATYIFYVECLELIGGVKYKPFVLQIDRNYLYGTQSLSTSYTPVS